MELVVEIPKEQYITLNAKSQEEVVAVLDYTLLVNAIKNGIPLPKGHGRLIDVDATCKDIISALGIRDENYLLEAEEAVYKRIKNAPTIIEKNKEQEDEQCIQRYHSNID